MSKPVDTRSTVLFTADDGAFPIPAPGRTRFSKDEVLGHLAEEVSKSVDGLLGQASAASRKKRLWDLSVGHDSSVSVPLQCVRRSELKQETESRLPLKVHILRTDRANTSFPLQPYVQAAEEGLLSSTVRPGTLVIPIHPSQVGDVHLPSEHQRLGLTLTRTVHYKMAISDALVASFPPYSSPPSIPLRALKYARNITLSFVILNEDSTDSAYVRSWDIVGALDSES